MVGWPRCGSLQAADAPGTESTTPARLDRSVAARVEFATAFERPSANLVPTFDIADCINECCPWSGKPVRADSLTEFGGRVVGFCNPDCRNRFETAVRTSSSGSIPDTR